MNEPHSLSREIIARAATRLQALRARVLLLSAVQGMSPAEIGRVLQMSEEQSTRLLALALADFDRVLVELSGPGTAPGDREA